MTTPLPTAVSGYFAAAERDDVDLDYRFTLRGQLISQLEIVPTGAA